MAEPQVQPEEERPKGHPTDAKEVLGPKAEALMWDLDLENVHKGLTWWWWWWLFFFPDPDDPKRTRQLMILWSTKYTEQIKVDYFDWKPEGEIERKAQGDDIDLGFNGMTAAWWYDGRKMVDPVILEPNRFKVTKRGADGILDPQSPKDLRLSGRPGKYRLDIDMPEDGHAFHLDMLDWTPFMSEHRYRANAYTKKYSYNILRIYGNRVEGTYKVDGEEVDAAGSTAYFQKVRVNAPAIPWYWTVLHTERGDYLDYFFPHIGPQLARKTEEPKSRLDWGDMMLNRSLQFWDEGRQRLFKFKKPKIKHRVTEEGLPVFNVRGKSDEATIELELEAYARAYWRFEQPKRFGFAKSILYYNEYPTQVNRFRLQVGSEVTDLGDLGWTRCNTEHTWGKLI
jgi:hypothetical protein